MYRCIAKLEIDLEGLSEFYSDVTIALPVLTD